MENQDLNPFTLQPISKTLRKYTTAYSVQKMPYVIKVCIFFASVSLASNLGLFICTLCYYESLVNDLLRCMGDIFRVIFYTLLFVLGRNWQFLQMYAVYVFPMLYSVLVCEIYAYTDSSHLIVFRVVSVSGLLLIYAKYTPINFMATLCSIVVCLVYPFIRFLSMALISTV